MMSKKITHVMSLSVFVVPLSQLSMVDRVLENVKVTNVKLTEGDEVVVEKSVKAGETFGMMSTRTESEAEWPYIWEGRF
ncbi:uncharacterized protein MONOS_3241 [Monocercomonoides exilis]|uniref:uncharacterized protein n=1 Tax=Monocercomonoides exilis TaxID=2049356 RepID=UPI00355A3FE6|nr:hypothetical protein MONOS_3241 [Monocercomonoides exilis]|eukprot:MONOS_3241.1-p1 / transcript=MONOS_3241.1 / gene=MONOS_3241 / organism=Monocercomonoides_exilis_PA203 / gene_product=unspecified product / transcript_product=unspecified product / location=Mono_scaffold00074:145476-145840(-) / protein_length=79 / sequence_SO=supercontig / SO=protein_coding / is_pseudo=false